MESDLQTFLGGGAEKQNTIFFLLQKLDTDKYIGN